MSVYGRIIGGVLFLLILYVAGPRLESSPLGSELPVIPAGIEDIAAYVKEQESHFPVKPDNESLILWGDTVGQATSYVLLYLHGFSASRYEGYPITHDFVREFGVNAYLPRLAGHGLADKEPLLQMTPENLYASAREALAVAHVLGKKVIIMGTSTGGTLGLMLAADFPGLVEGLILYSPNVRIKQKSAVLLSGPWGLQIGRLAFGGKYRITEDASDERICRYWTCKYRVEATVYLQQLLEARMQAEEFAKVKVPVFLAYYYRDEEHQDETVEVKAALRMFEELGTPSSEKEKLALPEAGAHVIGCELTSGAVDELREETFRFVRKSFFSRQGYSHRK